MGFFEDEAIKSKDAEIVRLRAREAELEAVLEAIRRDPYGCRFCDSGKLRTPNVPAKDHDDDCGYALMEKALRPAPALTFEKGEIVRVDHPRFKGRGIFEGWVYPRSADPFEKPPEPCPRSAAVRLENGNTWWYEEATVHKDGSDRPAPGKDAPGSKCVHCGEKNPEEGERCYARVGTHAHVLFITEPKEPPPHA